MLQQMLQQGDEGKVKNFLMDCDEVYRKHCKTLHDAHKHNGRLIEYGNKYDDIITHTHTPDSDCANSSILMIFRTVARGSGWLCADLHLRDNQGICAVPCLYALSRCMHGISWDGIIYRIHDADVCRYTDYFMYIVYIVNEVRTQGIGTT